MTRREPDNDTPDNTPPRTPTTNARAGAGPYGSARPVAPDDTDDPTIVLDDAGNPHPIHSMNQPNTLNTTGADQQAGDEAPQTLDRAVGKTDKPE